jgi:predicted phosphohydrolase
MTPIIIGLAGKKTTGKNTVATLITKGTRKWTFEVAFGSFVKQEVAVACGVTVDHINNNKEQFRTILQWWGTDFRRAGNSNYWVYKMDKLLASLYSEEKAAVIIITDVRFQNEYDYIKSINGILIRVSRPLVHDDTHLSETDLDKVHEWDSIILNTGTIKDLKKHVEELITKYKL